MRSHQEDAREEGRLSSPSQRSLQILSTSICAGRGYRTNTPPTNPKRDIDIESPAAIGEDEG